MNKERRKNTINELSKNGATRVIELNDDTLETVTGGVDVTTVNTSAGNYLQVNFDGEDYAISCAPNDINEIFELLKNSNATTIDGIMDDIYSKGFDAEACPLNI